MNWKNTPQLLEPKLKSNALNVNFIDSSIKKDSGNWSSNPKRTSLFIKSMSAKVRTNIEKPKSIIRSQSSKPVTLYNNDFTNDLITSKTIKVN